MRLKRFEKGRIEVSLSEAAEPTVAGELGQKLTELTGERWIVTVSEGAAAPTLRERHEAEQAALKDSVRGEPLVRALLERFDDAQIEAVRKNTVAEDPPAPDTLRKDGRWTS